MLEIEQEDLLDLIHWARRYCDGRSTYAPVTFNKIYHSLLLSYPFLIEKDFMDKTLMDHGKFFPYAQDAIYNNETNAYNALPKDYSKS